MEDYWTKKISSLCCVCELSKIVIFECTNLYFTQLAISWHQPASVSWEIIFCKDSKEKWCFSPAGSLYLDEDDAKACCVYNDRVVAISIGHWFKFFLQVIPFLLVACFFPLFHVSS